MDEIRWGIIGCGDVTEKKSGPAFNKVNNSRLVAVMRRNAEKAADYAQRHNVKKWYTDARKLIEDPEVNAIYIATPPLQHEEYALAAIAAGKPVYVEKPISLNAFAAQRMIDAAVNNDVKLCVAHYRRAQPMFLKIKQLLKEKAIGDIRFVNLKMLKETAPHLVAKSERNWRMDPAIAGGGLFHDLAPHQLDLMLYYFGAAQKFSGISCTQQTNATADDLVIGHILFESGVVFNGTWCFSVAPKDREDICEIYGSKGVIRFPIFGYQAIVSIEGVDKKYDFEPLDHVQQPMIEKVVDYFLGKGPNPSSAENALLSMEILDAFTQKN
ncbi:putative dehydrogenase [Pedobacter sp. UYP30]|uniref:Gfo/Idh/MocA family protein n=1 Tax=Pedobacter sp. UYP30 TaxID=1756400 RepID=UPI00339206F1